MSASAVGGKHRLAVGKAGARGIARHALDQRAEAGPVAIGAVLAPARDAHDDQAAGCARCSSAGPSPIFSSVPGRKFSISTSALGDQVEQQLAAARLAQGQRHALLVAGVELPVDADAVGLPGAQRVALSGSSILMTSAPKSASCEATALPATSRDRSTTRMPSSGQAASGSNDFSGTLIGRPILFAAAPYIRRSPGANP